MSGASKSPAEEPVFDGRVEVSHFFSINPLIPAKPLGKPVALYLWSRDRNCKFTVRIGAVSKNRDNDHSGGLCPSLHIDLWQLILALLSLWRERLPCGAPTMSPTFRQVWRRYSASKDRPSQSQREALAKLWDELDALRMLVQIPGLPDRVVDVVHYHTVRRTLNSGDSYESIAGFSFNDAFIEAVQRVETQDVRLDVIAPITSRYVRAAYLWVPRFALKPKPRRAPLSDDQIPVSEALRKELWPISSASFMNDLGAEPMSRSERKKLLLQNGAKSILWQLHGLPLLRRGLHLGVTSWDDDEQNEFFIGVYTYIAAGGTLPAAGQRKPAARGFPAIYRHFVAEGGGSEAALVYWINQSPLPAPEEYLLEQLTRYGVENVVKDARFYRYALALIGAEDFRTVVGHMSEAKVTKTAGGYFRTKLLLKIAERAQRATKVFESINNPAGSQDQMRLF